MPFENVIRSPAATETAISDTADTRQPQETHNRTQENRSGPYSARNTHREDRAISSHLCAR